MKKITNNELESITGGVLACGWVGMLAVASLGSPVGMIIGATSGLYSEVKRCWNS